VSDRVLLEEHRPLSQSLIWKVERAAYRAQGVNGWRQGTVPHYVTTNPFIAGSYAAVLLGFLRDIDHLERAGELALDVEEPITILELGAGPGRFAYHLLTQLLDLRDHSRLGHLRIRYVMSDLAEDNVAFWQTHPKLLPLVDAGVLDFARFDIEEGKEIELLASGDVLRPGSSTNPGIVVANYVFDSVPQDCFRTEGGRLLALLGAATSSQEEPELGDPSLLERIELDFVEAEVGSVELDLDEVSMAVLERYRERLGDTRILWPSIAIGCLDRLRSLWDGRMLLLSGDKGFSREGDLLDRGEPDVVNHGSVFSLMVNFHAIGEWFTHNGGFALHPAQRHTSLNVSTCAAGMGADALTETSAAYHGAIEALSPDDFFAVVLSPSEPETDLERFLAVLRLSRWDAEVLLRHLPGVGGWLSGAPPLLKDEVAWSVRQVWDAYYPIGESLDVAFYLSMVFYEIGYYAEAIAYLERSLDLYGPAGETFYNIALCHHASRDLDRALEFTRRASEFEDAADAAKSLRLRIEAEQDRPAFGSGRPKPAAAAEPAAAKRSVPRKATKKR
jgi:hypothetical protein